MHYDTPKDKRARYVRCMCTYLMILLLLWAVCVCILLLVLANHNAFKLHYGALFCSWSWRTIIYHDAFNMHYGTLSDWLRISHTLQYSIPSSHKKTAFACPFTTCSFRYLQEFMFMSMIQCIVICVPLCDAGHSRREFQITKSNMGRVGCYYVWDVR